MRPNVRFNPKLIQYFVKEKNFSHNHAIYLGFNPDLCVHALYSTVLPGYTHILGGLQFGSFSIYKQVRALGDSYIYVDRGYVHGQSDYAGFLRLTLNGFQQNWVEPRPMDRFLVRIRKGLQILPWRKYGRHILLVPPSSPQVSEIFGTPDWENTTIKRLKTLTDRPIIVSRKIVDKTTKSLAERFKDCHAVVTVTSNIAVDAVCAGIPVFCHPENAAICVGRNLTELDQIETPRMPPRIRWLSSLMYGQFNVDEIREGYARKIILGY